LRRVPDVYTTSCYTSTIDRYTIWSATAAGLCTSYAHCRTSRNALLQRPDVLDHLLAVAIRPGGTAVCRRPGVYLDRGAAGALARGAAGRGGGAGGAAHRTPGHPPAPRAGCASQASVVHGSCSCQRRAARRVS